VADLADTDSIASIIETVRPTHVVHLAAISFVAHSDIEQMYRTNVVGTGQLLAALSSMQAPPEMVVLASSANVYGNAREGT
jgi:nucleoside-diphosphate-sugar epimerase